VKERVPSSRVTASMEVVALLIDRRNNGPGNVEQLGSTMLRGS
jgi:hypothetical protein